MARLSLRRKLLILTAGLIAFTITGDSSNSLREKRQEIPQKIERREYSEKEKIQIEAFKKNAYLAGCTLEMSEKYVWRMLIGYETLNPRVQEEVREDMAKGLSHLRKFYEKAQTPDKLSKYDLKACEFGL